MDDHFRELAQPRIVDGYQLLKKIGAGGMSAVYEAISPDGTHVALKLLHPSFADTDSARRRLRREVAMLQRVHGEHVAQILDAELDGENLFIVTELIHGMTLEKDVQEEGRYTEEDLLQLGQKLGIALRSIHRAGVLHRDLKPSNVMMRDDEPVLIDFGISQTGADSRLTQTGFLTHTPGFCDPRILLGGEPDLAADWWAMAAVLAYAATGVFPFGQGLPAVVMNRVLHESPNLPQLTPELQALFASALAPDLAQRLAYPDLLAGIANPALTAHFVADFENFAQANPDQQTAILSQQIAPTRAEPMLENLAVGERASVEAVGDSRMTISENYNQLDQLGESDAAADNSDWFSQPQSTSEARTVQLQQSQTGAEFDDDYAEPATEHLPAPTKISPVFPAAPLASAAPTLPLVPVAPTIPSPAAPSAFPSLNSTKGFARENSAPAPLEQVPYLVHNFSNSENPNGNLQAPILQPYSAYSASGNFPAPVTAGEVAAHGADLPAEFGGYLVQPLKHYPLIICLLAAVFVVFGVTAPVACFLVIVLIGAVLGAVGKIHEKLIARRIRRGHASGSDFGAMLARVPAGLFSGAWRSVCSGFAGALGGAILYFAFSYNSNSAAVQSISEATIGQGALRQLLDGIAGIAASPVFFSFLLALLIYWVFPSSRTIRLGLKVTLQEIIPSPMFHVFWIVLLCGALLLGCWFGASAASPTWSLLM